MIHEQKIPDGFKIGSAAKIAGISPNTLRTWIRRGYFAPSITSPNGERLLDSADLRRVKNLKTLVEDDVKQASGHGIKVTRAKNGALTVREAAQ